MRAQLGDVVYEGTRSNLVVTGRRLWLSHALKAVAFACLLGASLARRANETEGAFMILMLAPLIGLGFNRFVGTVTKLKPTDRAGLMRRRALQLLAVGLYLGAVCCLLSLGAPPTRDVLLDAVAIWTALGFTMAVACILWVEHALERQLRPV